MSKDDKVEVVALIRRCQYCKDFEGCMSLPDEELLGEATCKVVVSAVAKVADAKVFEKDREFEDYLEKVTGYRINYCIVSDFRYDDEKRAIFFATKSISNSPLLVVIDKEKKMISILDANASIAMSNDFRNAFYASMDLVREVGVKNILKMSYKEIYDLLGD